MQAVVGRSRASAVPWASGRSRAITSRSTRTPNYVRSLRSLLSVAGHLYVMRQAADLVGLVARCALRRRARR